MLLVKILLYGFAITLPYQPGPAEEKKVEKNGMVLEWKMEEAQIRCKVKAPGTGWVAIGFNPKEGLTGTNLIMGAVRNGTCQMSDRFIVKPGEHKAISELGAKEKLSEIKGTEEDGSTTLEFCIPINSSDAYHHTLKAGNGYHVLLAYSQDDDFGHHSIMRTSVYITL